MSQQVISGAMLKCIFGLAPSTLVVVPKGPPVMASGPPAATIMDMIPMVNIPPFGMCMSPSNPMFIAATAAALGVPTPVPCMPVIPAPWIPGGPPTVMINNFPALNNMSKCMCTWAGMISILMPGQFTVMIP